MINSKRMLASRDVVAQNQIQLVQIFFAPRNRSDRVVRFAFGFCENERAFIGIFSPGEQNLFRQIYERFLFFARKPNHGHRPFYDSSFYRRKSLEFDLRFNRRARHRKFEIAALEMVVAQNRTADNRQVRVASERVVRKLRDEIQKPFERGATDFHRRVLGIENDAMLVVVDIRRILQAPFFARQFNRNDSVILARRVIYSAGVAFVFQTQ